MTKRMMRDKIRCPICDEWYDEKDAERAKVHEHPEPQSGDSRDTWLKSKLPYERWIKETSEGMMWDNRK